MNRVSCVHVGDDARDVGQSIGVEDHLVRILASVDVLPAEVVGLGDADGRVLAAEVTSAVDIPPFDNSAMDGYAVRRADVLRASAESPISLPTTLYLPAGPTEDDPLAPGTAARIMTGAPIPAASDAVIPMEQADSHGDRVVVYALPRPGAHIRRAGEDIRAGETVLAAGSVLTARHVAAAASATCTELNVHERPRVAVISTGNELVDPGRPLRRGQIPDSNSYLLAAAVRDAGAVPVYVETVPDDTQALRDTLTRCAGDVDTFVLSGGVSVGASDVVKAALGPLGVWFGSVRMQPGEPQGFGRWTTGQPVFALPGNPVSAFVSFEVFVRPALRRMQGFPSLQRRRIAAVAATGWRCPRGRQQYVPVVIRWEPDPVVTPVSAHRTGRPSRGSGSHLVASLALADGIAVIGEDVDEIRERDSVSVMVLTG